MYATDVHAGKADLLLMGCTQTGLSAGVLAMMKLTLVAAACSLQTVSALAARRPPPPDLTKIYKDLVAASNEPGSSAERPAVNKKRVAICGVGGDAGRFVFGYVQRAAQTFESGLTAPLGLVGAARGSRALNACLSSSFILAFADESLVQRCDFRSDEVLAKRVAGCGTIVTPYRLRPQGAVTGTEWTWDLDQAERGEVEPFARICAAAVAASAHVLAVAAPGDANDALAALEASGASHTLLVTNDLATTKKWNLNKGIQQVVGAKRGAGAGGNLQVEDLGATIAQAVAVLDPSKSRVLSLGALADGASTPQEALAKAINTALLSPA